MYDEVCCCFGQFWLKNSVMELCRLLGLVLGLDLALGLVVVLVPYLGLALAEGPALGLGVLLLLLLDINVPLDSQHLEGGLN